jgi:tetraacyldisaccharide 4'-kinase
MRRRLEQQLNGMWYQGGGGAVWFKPLSLLYGAVVASRQRFFKAFPPDSVGVPIVVVGGITAGGTGKTPVLIAIAQALGARGIRVGVVSRGYGGQYDGQAREVHADDDPSEVGDEPLLIARQAQVPVVIAHRRREAAEWLVAENSCDLILSDDGLQHGGLPRDLEIIVLDAQRGLGNGLLLPAGPLREQPDRRAGAVTLIRNGDDPATRFHYRPVSLRHMVSGRTVAVSDVIALWSGQSVTALTGLGQPEQFFDTLRGMGLAIDTRVLADHEPLSPQDLAAMQADCIVVTEKDAVKLSKGDDRVWSLIMETVLPPTLVERVSQLLV